MNTKIYLRKNEERRIKAGHLWIFSNEISNISDDPQNGDLVAVFDSKNNFIGTGFYNKNSLIAVRILSDQKTGDLRAIFRERLTNALDLRKKLYPERNSFRLVFSESDFLPGLIIDKYNNSFVLQVYSFGIERNIDLLIEVLKEDFSAENIFTKQEEHFRLLEGLPVDNTVYLGEMKSEIISDGSVKYTIDFAAGHKTGFYFDQSDNRYYIERFVKGKSILDAFCNGGGFGLHAAKAGASSVTFVDSSSNEIENAGQNFRLNDLKAGSEFIVSDVFDYLESCINHNKQFDVVMIDPPAFAKSRKSVPVAKKGYERLNKLALQSVCEKGFLVSSSCSHHISEVDFIDSINRASIKAGRKIRLIYFNGASLDHPKIPAMPETEYLKFGIFVVD